MSSVKAMIGLEIKEIVKIRHRVGERTEPPNNSSDRIPSIKALIAINLKRGKRGNFFLIKATTLSSN